MSTTYNYKKIDAFTAKSSLGNPAACIYLDPNQFLTEDEMLDIAKQHKGFVSEVVYCTKGEKNVHLIYFSSECEVDFCGHGTIACMYSLIKDNADLLAQSEIQINTNKKGLLTVYNKILEQDAVLITAPKPLYIGTELTGDIIAENLKIKSNDIDNSLAIDLIDAGLRTLIVPIKNLDTEINIFPSEQDLKAFCLENGIDIILVFSKEVSDSSHIAHTRVFAPKFGYLEDPATGSGNSAFAYYMLKNQLWNGDDCCVEQGGIDRIYNEVHLSLKHGSVLFGGSATVRIDGVFIK